MQHANSPPPLPLYHMYYMTGKMSVSNITGCINCLVSCLLNLNYQMSCVPDCERPLGLEEDKTRIRSPSSLTDPRFPPNAARLNGPSAWCPSRTPAYLQIDLDKSYKLTAIATQGGTALKKWVQRYTISFYAGNIIIYYTESGSRKVRSALLFIILTAVWRYNSII